MNIIADTNLLVRAIIAEDPVAAVLARRLLESGWVVTIPTVSLCEFVWVATKTYKSPRRAIASVIRDLMSDPKVVCDRDAVDAGLAMLNQGGDFADGVIDYEGRRPGGTVFATFDRKAASLIAAQGHAVDLLAAAP